MEKSLKINSRIAVEWMSCDECVFLIDGLKKARFTPQDGDFFNLIDKLVTSGIKEDHINTIQSDLHRKRAKVFLNNLEENGFLDYALKFDNEVKVKIFPIKKKFKFPEIKENFTNDFKISSLTFFKYLEDRVILENPLSSFKVCIEDPFFNLQVTLKEQKKINELLSVLMAGGFIHSVSQQHQCNWEFHDLLFHTKSRLGMIDDCSSIGGTYKFKPDNIEHLNGFKDYKNNKYFQLDDPLETDKASFFKVLHARRSSRSFSNHKIISYSQISEFLFHTAKVNDTIFINGHLDFIKKTFPSAGGIHDLEFYLLINKNDNLPRDIYYYHPQHHGLYQLQVQNNYLDEITENSMAVLGNINQPPPIIVILTSKFKKMRSKYERIAYRNTIISVGAAFQTMYLIGAAMNLSTCALGSGNPDLFAEAIGIDPLEECSVGEFVIGSLN